MPAGMKRSGSRRTINEINMVPFIDVMLVLLIIFMVTAPMLTPSMVDLPSVGQANKQPAHITQVVIAKDGTLTLKTAETSRAIALKDVASAVVQLQNGKTDNAVVISADRNVKYETVVKVMSALKTAGAQRVGLSVQLAN